MTGLWILFLLLPATTVKCHRFNTENFHNISFAIRDLALSISAHQIQISFDVNHAELAPRVVTVLHDAVLPIQVYNITSKTSRIKYCNDTSHFLDSVPGITNFVLCSPRRAAKFIKQVDVCGLAGRHVLYVLVWRTWPRANSDVRRSLRYEAIRIAVLSYSTLNTNLIRIFSSQADVKQPRALLPVNFWSGKLRRHPALPLNNNVYRDLKGRTLIIPVLHKPPWYFVERRQGGELAVQGGRDHQLLKELAVRMNFQYQYVDPPERTQGSSLGSNSSTWRGGGVLALLQRREVDMYLGDAAVTYERAQGLDFSFFTLADSVAFVTHSPRPLSEALALVRPFQWQVWVAVTAVLGLSGPILFLVTSLPLFKKNQGHLAECLWVSFAIFLKQSCRLPKRCSCHKARLLVLLLSLSATYVIGDLYCANLTSLLAKPGKERPIRTLTQLENAVAARRYDLLVEQRSSAVDFLRNGTDEARRLWRHMKYQSRAFVPSVERGVALVRARRGIALLASRETLYFETLRFGSRYFHLSDPVYTRYSAIAIQPGCPYLDTINSIVIHLYEAGVLDRMTSLEYARLGRSTFRHTGTKEEAGDEEIAQTMQPLSAKMLQGAFFVLLVGYIIAGVSLLFEMSLYKKCHVSRPRGARDTWYSRRRVTRVVWRARQHLRAVVISAIEIPYVR